MHSREQEERHKRATRTQYGQTQSQACGGRTPGGWVTPEFRVRVCLCRRGGTEGEVEEEATCHARSAGVKTYASLCHANPSLRLHACPRCTASPHCAPSRSHADLGVRHSRRHRCVSLCPSASRAWVDSRVPCWSPRRARPALQPAARERRVACTQRSESHIQIACVHISGGLQQLSRSKVRSPYLCTHAAHACPQVRPRDTDPQPAKWRALATAAEWTRSASPAVTVSPKDKYESDLTPPRRRSSPTTARAAEQGKGEGEGRM